MWLPTSRAPRFGTLSIPYTLGLMSLRSGSISRTVVLTSVADGGSGTEAAASLELTTALSSIHTVGRPSRRTT